MAKEFRLPELGENVQKGTIARILIAEGQQVSKDDAILEVETDKAVVEIPSPFSGVVKKLRVKEGQSISVGDAVFEVEEGDAPKAAGKPQEEAPKSKPAASAPKPEEPAEPQPKETPPAAKPGPVAAPGARAASASAARRGPVLASPSVRRLAREMGVDLNEVPQLDAGTAISAAELLAYAQGTASRGTSTAQIPADLERDNDDWGRVALQPLSGIRKATAQHMTKSWSEIPHVTHFEKADITSLETVRKSHAAAIEKTGGKLTITCFVLKVLAEALKRFPRFNASLDLEHNLVRLKEYYHIGVAVDTEHGLLVPVVRHVDRKSIAQIAEELPDLAERARARKLALDDMRGGTFTVTNLGGLGVHQFAPIINTPEVAILAISRAQMEPVWQQGQFAPRLMLPLSISYDHRVIDGADAARFMHWVIEALEQPWALFLDS